MIWLVDYSHYNKTIVPELAKCKRDYFRLKNYVRYNKIGETAAVGTRIFNNGLLRIATILTHNGIDVEYVHYYQLEDRIRQKSSFPEIIAFSAVCPTIPLCASLANEIKRLSPKTKIFAGGPHINLNPKTTSFLFPVFDELIVGYEKQAAEKICKKKLFDIDYPYADYSLLPFPLQEYAINTFTTMGCPFHCSYCVDGMSPHFRASPDGQISILKNLLPPKTLIHFFDSVLGYSKDGMHQVFDRLKKTEHHFLLSCDMRADLLDERIIKEMADAGFVEIRMGMESADTALLKRNERTLSKDSFDAQIKMIRSCSDIYIALYTITGLPGTTWDIQADTLEYCEELLCSHLVDEIKNGLYVPYPIEGVDYSKRGIRIINTDLSCYDRQSFPVFCTEDMSAEDLWRLYLHTAKSINTSWLKSTGFSSFADVPERDNYYQEYVQHHYLINSNQ